MRIKFLKAHNGDAILISVKYKGQDRNILIDGGIGDTYQKQKNKKGKSEDGELKRVIAEIRSKGQKIDLLVLTHVDDDHIGGILRWFEKDLIAFELIEKVWFNSGKLIAEYFKSARPDEYQIRLLIKNSYRTSIGQGTEFEEYLLEKQIWERILIKNGMLLKNFGLEFLILSPDDKNLKRLLRKWIKERPESLTSGKKDDYEMSLKEHIKNDNFKQDTSVHNGSSIAFILGYKGKRWLFLGDAHPKVIVESLKREGFSEDSPLEVELVKLSHHGSKGNNSLEMLKMIKSKYFVVSTDGSRHNHPDKQMLSRLIRAHPDCKILFNYEKRKDLIFTDQDKSNFQFETLGISEPLEYEFVT